jgi:tetratricopeptide (TPR) repeat protein
MKFTPHLATVIIGATATAALVQPLLTQAQPANTVSTIARQVTVKIDGQAPGSGVIIHRQGQVYYVLTANHVVQTEDEYEVITPDGKKHRLDYKQVKKFPGVDLALVSFTSPENYRVVEMGRSQQITAGSPTYVSGFPMQGTRTSQTEYRFTDGEIVAQANKPLANGYALAYFNDTFAGMSGGPVLNQQGQLIGIHGAAKLTGVLGHMRQETQGIDLSTGRKLALNLGIPIDTFLNLVSNVAPNLKFAAVPPRLQTAQPTADDLLIRSIEQEFAGKVSGDNESALTLVNQAIQLQPNYGAAYLHRGHVRVTIADIFLLVGKTPESKAKAERYIAEAVVDYTEAIRLNPKLVSAYLNRGMLRRQSGDLAGALSDYNEVLRLNPNSDLAYNNRAVVRFFQKDFQGALLDWDQTIRLNPYFTDAYRQRALIYNRLSDYRKAIADLDQAIRLNPKAWDYFQRGSARKDIQDYQGAIADFGEAIQRDPKFAAAYNERGGARRRLKDYAGAVADFTETLRLRPNSAEAYLNRGLAQEEAGNLQAAVADLQKAADLAGAEGNSKVQSIATYNVQRLKR